MSLRGAFTSDASPRGQLAERRCAGPRAWVLLMLGCTACVASTSEDGEDLAAPLRSLQELSSPAPGAVIVERTSGVCPSRPWEVSSKNDGETHVVTASTPNSYTGILTPDTFSLPIACYLTAQLNVPAGRSYALAAVAMQGTTLLSEAAEGVFTVRYSAGSSWPNEPRVGVLVQTDSAEFKGPFGGVVGVEGTVPSANLRWSVCGEPYRVGISAITTLTNQFPPGTSSFTLAVGGRTSFQLRFLVKRCTATPNADAGTL